MPNDGFHVVKGFLVIMVVIVVGSYTTYHLMRLSNSLATHLEGPDSEFFKDGGLLSDEERAKKQHKLQDNKEVKKRSVDEGSIIRDLDNSLASDFMADYNLDFTTTVREEEEVSSDYGPMTSSQPDGYPMGTTSAFSTTTAMPPSSAESSSTESIRSTVSSVDAPNTYDKPTLSTPVTPSAAPTRKTNAYIYTSPEIQKIAQEYFSSVSMNPIAASHKTPTTSPTPSPDSGGSGGGGLDSTKFRPRVTTQRPTKPKYTSYKIPPTFTLPPPCFRQPYKLKEVCTLTGNQTAVKGENVTLEDIAKMLFLKSTLGNLKDNCPPGVWCVEEDFELQNTLDDYLPFCELQGCLDQMSDECLNEERRLVLSTLFLFCQAKSINVSDECMFGIRKMVHVTMTDIYRTKFRKTENVCTDMVDRNECNGTCKQNAQNLYCMSTVCQSSLELFKQFDPWSWYFNLEDADEKCLVNETNCVYFEMELLYESWWNKLMRDNYFLGALHDLDIKLVVGIVCVFMATMAGMVVLLWACMRRASLYSRDKVGYKEIKGLQDPFAPVDSAGEDDDEFDEWDIENPTFS